MDDGEFVFILGLAFGALVTILILVLFAASGGYNYNGIQTIHVVDKYPYGSGAFSVVTCDQVYYVHDPVVFSKIAQNGTYKVKFSSNPMQNTLVLTDIISGDATPAGCS